MTLPPNNINSEGENIDHPSYEMTIESDEDKQVIFVAKSIYGNYEAINKYPMSAAAAVVLAFLILKEALMVTNAIEEQTGDEEDDEG